MELPIDLDAVTVTLQRHRIGFALVFGSHATGRARPNSDVDLAVWSDGPVDDWALRGELPDDVDLLDLRRAPDHLAGRVAMEGVVVFDADARRRIRWQAETRKRHLDEEFRRRRFRQDFVRSHG